MYFGMVKRALVTGASRGIGRAIATRLAREGFDLVLTCVYNIEELQKVAIDLKSQYNILCEAVLCDGGDSKQVEKLFEVQNDYGVVVNNAGISFVGLLQDMTEEEWDKVINTNLKSVFNISKLSIPKMVEKKEGRIINISSMWGDVGASCEVAYSASKGGVNSFTKALAKELAPSNIAVNAISCGVIDTDMNGHLSSEEKDELADSIPVGRFASPDEVAELVWNIIQSPAYLTGQIVRIDGGMI